MIARPAHIPDGQANHLGLPPCRGIKQAGFTLVEMTLAIGVLALAMIPLVGLLPMGLNVFHQAIDSSVESQMAQLVTNEAQQTDFNTLIGANTTRFLQSTTPRYFDAQGNELAQSTNAIYQVRTILTPRPLMPYNPSSTTPLAATNANLCIVTVQIARNPGNAAIVADPTTLFWNSNTIPIATYSAVISNNQ
jgi:uncharacterized protein (TIGR02598 family)